MASNALGAVVGVFLTGVAAVLGWLPGRVRVFWGNRLGALIGATGFRSKVVRENLETAFPGQAETQQIVFKRSYRHLGNLILEILLLFGAMKRFVLKETTVIGLEHTRAALGQGTGFIFLSSHLGNWEIMAAAGGMTLSTELMLVTKRVKPEWLHQLIESARRRCRVIATYEPRTLRDILGHLKKKGAVGFVLDQYAGPPVGVRVPVFGKPVGTPLVVAAIAKRAGVPVLPVENYRLSDGRWVVHIHEPLPWMSDSDGHRELALNTALYASTIEKQILAHSEQWLWTHRRFKGDLSPLKPGEWNEPRTRR